MGSPCRLGLKVVYAQICAKNVVQTKGDATIHATGGLLAYIRANRLQIGYFVPIVETIERLSVHNLLPLIFDETAQLVELLFVRIDAMNDTLDVELDVADASRACAHIFVVLLRAHAALCRLNIEFVELLFDVRFLNLKF